MAHSTADTPHLDMSTAVSDTDRSIVVTIACWLSLIASLIFYGARLNIRWPLKELFGKDDTACTVSTVFALIQTALMLFAADHGLGVKGTELASSSVESIEKIVWTSDLFYVLSLVFSKLAVAALLNRFSAAPERIRVFRAIMYAVCAYGIVGLFITALRQSISKPWHYTTHNVRSNLNRWNAFGAISVLLEVIALIAAIYLVWNIQMERKTKTAVVLAFAVRAPTIAFTVLRLVALSKLDGEDFTWKYVTPEIYTQFEMHFSLIAATIPCLRIFLKSWHARFLNMALEELDEQAYAEHAAVKGTYPMGSIQSSRTHGKSGRKTNRLGVGSGDGPWAARKDYGVSHATVDGGRENGDTESENSQKAIVIKQTVDVDCGRQDREYSVQ